MSEEITRLKEQLKNCQENYELQSNEISIIYQVLYDNLEESEYDKIGTKIEKKLDRASAKFFAEKEKRELKEKAKQELQKKESLNEFLKN